MMRNRSLTFSAMPNEMRPSGFVSGWYVGFDANLHGRFKEETVVPPLKDSKGSSMVSPKSIRVYPSVCSLQWVVMVKVEVTNSHLEVLRGK